MMTALIAWNKRTAAFGSVCLVVLLLLGRLQDVSAFVATTTSPPDLVNHHHHQLSSTTAVSAFSKRELEIRRKIKELKKQGRLKKQRDEFEDDDDDDDEMAVVSPVDQYSDKIRQKLGSAKSKLLGFDGKDSDDDSGESEAARPEGKVESISTTRRAQIGTLPNVVEEKEKTSGYQRIDESDSVDDLLDIDDDDDEDEEELAEEDLVDLVAQRMQEKRDQAQREKDARMKKEARERLAALEAERKQAAAAAAAEQKQITSGVGGSWSGGSSNADAKQDVYQPKTGSWGAFPRPRDISKAYGGGRRVGPGYSNEKERLQSEESTREKLQRYRVKVGIDVESEKEHAAEIDEALQLATIAMQRGVYSTAVSVLEQVTKYCSSNSKVGGKVFLELAMAYEAVGRTQEAIKVYRTLSRSRIEQIKINAKRLLYGIEAMQFMQENVSSSEFSRKRAKATFIDTTGLGNIASKFDDVYETAYIDLDRGFYKKLTESVVRSSREARQILLKATGPGEVQRMRIVQALRSLNRRFSDALQLEIENAVVKEPVAVMDGKPIVVQKESDDLSDLVGMEDFHLADPQQMMENLDGEWRLQLLADKRGDGVKFFNTTVAWQKVDSKAKTFTSLSPQGFLTVQQSGGVQFNDKMRIMRRNSLSVSGGGGMFAGLFGSKTGAVGAISTPQQIVLVDSALLVTRGVPSRRRSAANSDDDKDYFAVWRRVEPGTFSNPQKQP